MILTTIPDPARNAAIKAVMADAHKTLLANVEADRQLVKDSGLPSAAVAELTFPLSEAARDNLRRIIAGRKDAAMLGDSGYERIEADFYPTPPENVDCLLEHVQPFMNMATPKDGHLLIWEPACGKGDISTRLMDFGYEAWSSDLHDQGFGTPGMDFLAQTKLPNPDIRAIITNPPYETIDLKEARWAHLAPLAAKYGMTGKVGLAELFVRHSLALMQPVRGQVAMFLRNEFDCSKGRMDLFGLPPFHKKIVVTKRPRWIEGSTGSPRHNYAWFVWDWRHKAGPAAVTYSHPDSAPGPITKH